MMDEFDVLILGGGLAGISAALRAAELGGRVCLVEKGSMGRVGFHRRNALYMERRCAIAPGTDWDEYKKALDSETEAYSQRLKTKLDAEGVSVVEGEGRLVSPVEVSVQKKNGEYLSFKGKSVILAYGSDTRFPPTLPHEEGVVISIDEIAQLPVLPEKVLLVGSGAFASEAALGFQNRGCKVFLCSDKQELFPEMDEDFNVEIDRQLKEKKIKVLAGKRLVSFYKKGAELEITLETGIKFSVHQIIIAGDRTGVADSAEIEKLGIRLGDHHKVFVDEAMMTSLPGVYAVGSITGELTSDALSQEEGKVAAENALGKKKKLNLDWVPQTARLSPDVSYVGCTMKTAGHQGFHPIEGVFEEDSYTDINSSSSGHRNRFKVVADKRSRLIVGVQVIANQSADWISLILLLIKKGITIGNLANSTHFEGAKINGLREAARNCLQALKSP